MPDGYPLEELFLHLRRHGVPLGWRDYQDALAAVGCGFGVGRRQDLLRVLQVLWARSDAEMRTIEQAFGEIAPPAPEEIEKYTRAKIDRPPAGRRAATTPGSSNSPAQQAKEDTVALDFGATEARGLAIPKPALPRVPGEAFVLTPQPPVTLRSMIVAWRRFQKRLRQGPGVTLDVAGSIAEQCRTGRLLAPVLQPDRKNLARLVVLIDVSPSMAAWSVLIPMWEESIAQGQLGSAAVFYFSNVPVGVVYANRRLLEPVELEDSLRTHSNSALLVFSDAGAARGTRNRQRMEQTREFLKRSGLQWTPVVWLNPLPEIRWKGTTASWLARQSKLHMLPLGEAFIARAMDLLRGARAA